MEGCVKRILMLGYPIQDELFPDTSKSPESVYCNQFLYKLGISSSLGCVCTNTSLDLIEFSA